MLHSQDEDFKPHHDHEAVEKLAIAIDDIELRQELLYDIKLSRTYIIEWMCHVLRGVRQEKAKLYAISQLDPSCVIWLSDWAQKVIPSMFREGQRDYFGKKRMSVHVDVLPTKAVASSELMKSVFYYNLHTPDNGSRLSGTATSGLEGRVPQLQIKLLTQLQKPFVFFCFGYFPGYSVIFF